MIDSNASAQTMADLFSASLDNTIRIVSSVAQDRWSSATPCSEWTVSDLVNHLTNENLWAVELLAGKTTEEVGDRLDGDLLDNDPVGSYISSAEKARDAAFQPGALEVICHLSFGDVQGSVYLSQIFMDTLLHGWGIAVGSGQNTDLPPDLVTACYPIAQIIRKEFGEYGIVGEDLEDPSADMQDRLLGVLGRRR